LAEPGRTRRIKTDKEWAEYQREQSDPEVYVWGADREEGVWADGLEVDPDTVVVVEAKFVDNPKRSMYEGTVYPPALLDKLLEKFDKEIERYGAVIRHAGNPVGRLRLVASTEAAGRFLGDRARRILGSHVDLDVQVRKKGGA